MFWREQYKREADTLTLNQTYKEDLSDQGMLGSLFLRISGTGVSDLKQATGGKWRLLDYIDEINIIADGTRYIKKITGLQADAICFFDQGMMPPHRLRNYGAASQWLYFLINFGRYLYDPEMGLDLGKFSKVELQVKLSATSSEFAANPAITFIELLKMDGGGFPLGYMKSEEFKSWTTVQNAWEYTDLPTLLKLRRILLQLRPALDSDMRQKTNIFNMADDVEFTFKSGDVKIFKGGIDDLVHRNIFEVGRWVETYHQPYIAADKGFYTGVGYVIGRTGISGSKDGAVSAVIPTIEADDANDTQRMEAYEADSPVQYHVAGLAPHGCVQFKFDQELDPATWLDLVAQKTVKLDVHTRDHADAASGTNYIILERQEFP